MPPAFNQFLLGFALSALVSLAAWRVKALSTSGAWTAFGMGGLIFGLGGIPWAALLLTFFISSSLLSRLFGRQKKSLAEKFSKGSRRDWQQVLANGGLGIGLVCLAVLLPGAGWVWAFYAGTMAAVNADTWATELGVLSRQPPRLITTGEVVEKGTSGAVSLLGSLASLGGASLVALVAALLVPATPLAWVILGGVAGSLFDSWLGATVQVIYHCPACGKETERHPLHTCGTQTTPVRGWRWLGNDLVNLACSLVGGLAAMLGWYLAG